MSCSNSTCLNGGVCISGVLCACPAGWLNDNVGYFHGQNCSLPESFLQVFFIVCTIVSAISVIAILHVAGKAKEVVMQFKLFYVSWLVVDWLAVLAVYLEGGFFAAACVLTAIYSWIGTAIPAFIVLKILKSYFALAPEFKAARFCFLLKLFVVVWNVAATGILFAAASMSRTDTYLYNQLITAWFIVQGVSNVVFLALVLLFLNRLKTGIMMVMSKAGNSGEGSGGKKDDAKRVIAKLSGLTQIVYTIAPFSSVNIAIGVALFALGDLPYLWILWLFWMTGPVQNLGNSLKMFKQNVSPSTSQAEGTTPSRTVQESALSAAPHPNSKHDAS